MGRTRNGDGGEPCAVPTAYHGAEGRPGPTLFTIKVDGEVFRVSRAHDGGTAYDWLSGPNVGYGFGSSSPTSSSRAEHQEHIRAFLSMIDPATGYIGDE